MIWKIFNPAIRLLDLPSFCPCLCPCPRSGPNLPSRTQPTKGLYRLVAIIRDLWRPLWFSKISHTATNISLKKRDRFCSIKIWGDLTQDLRKLPRPFPAHYSFKCRVRKLKKMISPLSRSTSRGRPIFTEISCYFKRHQQPTKTKNRKIQHGSSYLAPHDTPPPSIGRCICNACLGVYASVKVWGYH